MAAQKKVRIQLSPPQFTYFNEIKNSIGKDPLVRVDPIRELPDGNVYVVTIHVRGLRKARALATLIAPDKSFGNVRVLVQVKTGVGKLVCPIPGFKTAPQIMALYRVAFGTNPLFQDVKTRAIFGTTSVYPIFRARVVQFFNDDLSDYYSNYNNVAAYVFRNVLLGSIGRTAIQFSTVMSKRK